MIQPINMYVFTRIVIFCIVFILMLCRIPPTQPRAIVFQCSLINSVMNPVSPSTFAHKITPWNVDTPGTLLNLLNR